MVITKRDELIMKVCLEQYFMTLVQISRMFFEKSQNIFEVPMKRVRELVNAGYLKSVQLRIGEKRLYVTTPKGVRHLKKKNLANGFRAVKEVNDKTWEHDEAVTDVRIVFEKLLGFTEWVPERLLKKQNIRRKVPDAIVSNGNKRYVIEVETSLKNKHYYEHVLPELCTRYHREDAILYIMKDETEMKWLMNQAKGWDQIYFTTLSALGRICYGLKFTNAFYGREIYLERVRKGSVLFHDPDDPDRDFDLDEDEEPVDEEEEEDEFDRYRQEEEEDRKQFEKEEFRDGENQSKEK